MDMAELSEFKNYIGDVSLEYGGLFINLDNFKHGYADCLRVIDLENGGTDGAVMVERITVCFDDSKIVKDALKSCGWDKPIGKDAHSKQLCIVETVAGYGYYDPVSDMSGPHCWILVEYDSYATQEEIESWRGEIVRLTEDQDVFEYLYNEGFLSEFE
jgi:hypothetical protein